MDLSEVWRTKPTPEPWDLVLVSRHVLGATEVGLGIASAVVAGIGAAGLWFAMRHGGDAVLPLLWAGLFGLWGAAFAVAGLCLLRGGRWWWTGQLLPVSLIAFWNINADLVMEAAVVLAVPLAWLGHAVGAA